MTVREGREVWLIDDLWNEIQKEVDEANEAKKDITINHVIALALHQHFVIRDLQKLNIETDKERIINELAKLGIFCK